MRFTLDGSSWWREQDLVYSVSSGSLSWGAGYLTPYTCNTEYVLGIPEVSFMPYFGHCEGQVSYRDSALCIDFAKKTL